MPRPKNPNGTTIIRMQYRQKSPTVGELKVLFNRAPEPKAAPKKPARGRA